MVPSSAWNVGLKAYITMYPTSGKAGTEVGIIGQGFDSASVVKFGGVAATKVALTGDDFLHHCDRALQERWTAM